MLSESVGLPAVLSHCREVLGSVTLIVAIDRKEKLARA
jgi:hypothetical protein